MSQSDEWNDKSAADSTTDHSGAQVPRPRDLNDKEMVAHFLGEMNNADFARVFSDRLDRYHRIGDKRWGRLAQISCGWSADNGLQRTNWFNGRYMTAEALQRDQVYFDRRIRAAVQTQHAGIAWGLGLEYPSHYEKRSDAAKMAEFESRSEMDGLLEKYRAFVAKAATEEFGEGESREEVEATIAELERKISECRDRPAPPKTRPDCEGQKPSKSSTITLRPGVAFDGAGRPVVVGEPVDFNFAELLDEYTDRPVVALASRTSFAPCLCVTDMPPGTPDSGPAHEPGPYFLVIQPENRASGRSKVHNEVCGSPEEIHCEADYIQEGFGLRLVKFPLGPDAFSEHRTLFDLRGELAAFYFDVWEHDLLGRWEPPFPAGDTFCGELGRFQKGAGAIPLAMVWVDQTGDISFIDPWIPRRYQIGNASEAMAFHTRGAPTPSSTVARSHQFQCHLSEALQAFPQSAAMHKMVEDRRIQHYNSCAPQQFRERSHYALAPELSEKPLFGFPPNLYELGLRHIPPFGFLPLEEPWAWLDDTYYTPDVRFDEKGNASYGDGENWTEREQYVVRLAKERAQAYFAGTNVITIPKVALHDDDIFEDIREARDKDPIELRDFGVAWWECIGERGGLSFVEEGSPFGDTNPFASLRTDKVNPHPNKTHLSLGVILYLILRPRAQTGLTLEKLVNREIDVVELVIPLEGLRRRLEAPTSRPRKRRGPGADQVLEYFKQHGVFDEATPGAREFAEDYIGASAKPRSFAFYVKRRLVLWEIFYRLLDTFLDELQLVTVALAPYDPVHASTHTMAMHAEMGEAASPTEATGAAEATSVPMSGVFESISMLRSGSAGPQKMRTEELRELGATADLPGLSVLRAVAKAPGMIETLAEVTRSMRPEMRLKGTLDGLERQKTRILEKQPDLSEETARDRAIDDLASVHPGYQFHRIVAALAPDKLDDYHEGLRTLAERKPVVDSQGEEVDKTIIDRAIFEERYDVWDNDRAKELFSVARKHLAARPIREMVDKEIERDIALGSVLERSRVDLEKAVGREAGLQLEERLAKQGPKLVRALNTAASSEAFDSPAFWKRYQKAVATSDTGISGGLDQLAEDSGGQPSHAELASRLKDVHAALGDRKFRAFVDEAPRRK